MRRIPDIRLPALLLLAAWLLVPAPASAETLARLSTRFLARGEQALLEISVTGVQPTAFPDIPPVNGVEIRPAGRGPQTQLLPGRRLEYVFEYLVSSYDSGNHVLPSFEVKAGGATSRTEPIEFTVFNPDELVWSEAMAGNYRFRYASAFRVMNSRPYDGEAVPVEIKIFVPRELRVEDWGIPDFERDGVTSWRFQPSAMRGQVNLLGAPFVSVAYPSTLTPTRTGKVGIGPATIRLVTVQYAMNGIGRNLAVEANLTVPKLELDARPLPPGAPEGFENAIGDFRIAATTSVTELSEGDPVPVDIVVSGSGNLDTLRPPRPMDATGWKVYEPAAEQRGDERRELSGSTIFHQFLRPLELKPAVPPFRLVFFDPKKNSYQTLLTEPIPLQMKPAVMPNAAALGPPQALPVPVERMTDILAPLSPASWTVSTSGKFPSWIGHALGALLALGLLAKAFWMRHGHRFHKDPVRAERLRELREIERIKAADATGFLMSAGRFIERWLGANPSPEIRAVLNERDSHCFRGEAAASPRLDPRRRQEILRALRQAATVWLLAAVFLTGQARAGDAADRALEAYESARYDEAIATWLRAGSYESLAPDTLYNIGNACYRAGSPGHAALYYRRALARDPGHPEARQNLRFIERKYGAITVHRPEYQYALARLPLATWKNLVWTGAWMTVLAALVFPATRPGARLRVAAIAALSAGPLLAACGGLGWRYFPNDAEFAPLARQAVIVEEKAVLHADAARTSPEVIDAPPGSLCEVLHSSGRWAYVAFATKTRGWVPSAAIEMVIPASAPAPPKIRKPKADDKSA